MRMSEHGMASGGGTMGAKIFAALFASAILGGLTLHAYDPVRGAVVAAIGCLFGVIGTFSLVLRGQ